MQKSITLHVAIGLFLTSCIALFGQESNSISCLRAAPTILGEQYRCDTMVRAVNNLRRIGKERALTILKGYLDEVGPNGDPNQKEKVLIICRLLFIKEEGWKPPGLGHPEPDVDPTLAKLFPLFPIAMSHNVPFLLVRGYASGGYSSDTPEKCVEESRNLSLIPSDLSESNFEKAAFDLTQRDEFQKLYPKSKDVREAINMVLAQGEPTIAGVKP